MIDLGKLVPKKTLDKLYDHALSGGAKEIGKLGTDAAKALRLLLAPIQVLAALEDRIEPMIDRIRKRVPEQRRVEPPAEVVGPVLEKMHYLSDESELWKMFEEVLTKVIDQDEVAKIHPAFTYLISQLSRDEAWMLCLLRDKDFNVVDTMELSSDRTKFINRKIEQSELPTAELVLPEKMDLYYTHLESLSLVRWPVIREEAIREGSVQSGTRRWSTMTLTDFGRFFVQACIPPQGFEHTAGTKKERKKKARQKA